MNALKAVFVVLALSLIAAGCDRPGAEQCRKAVENIRVLTGTATADIGKSPNAVVRSCRATASRQSVECIVAAKTLNEVEKCGGPLAVKFKQQLEDEEDESKASAQDGGTEKAPDKTTDEPATK